MHQELLLFFRTLLFGAALAVIYDCLKIVRNTVGDNGVLRSVQDFLYWCFAGISLFVLLYRENDGAIRLYALLGITLGAWFYHVTISTFFVNILTVFLSKVKRIIKIPLKPLAKRRKRLKFQVLQSKIALCRRISLKKVGIKRNETKMQKNFKNRIGMLCIIFVVGILFTALMMQSNQLRQKLDALKQEEMEIAQQVTEEEERTEDIDKLKEHMQTDEYYEEVAREKFGLFKENETVYKEKE